MQRYGPPPSYPNLKIPGLNAPIPESCSFGYHAGGWGKPPVDEYGRPLYGDVFGMQGFSGDVSLILLPVLAGSINLFFFVLQPILPEEEVDRTLWGELESEEEEEEVEESEEEEAEQEGAIDQSGLVTPAEGLATPSGFSSVPAGLETPDMIELRKKKIESEMEK
jgi:splicing factor 3B subunit 2